MSDGDTLGRLEVFWRNNAGLSGHINVHIRASSLRPVSGFIKNHHTSNNDVAGGGGVKRASLIGECDDGCS